MSSTSLDIDTGMDAALTPPHPLLALVDVLDADGHTRHSHSVRAGPDGQARLRIGRALDADLVLDDPHLAAHHAELHLDAQPEGRLHLLPSRNGARQGRQHHAAGAQLAWAHGADLHLGHTRLRLRHAAGALAPELAHQAPAPASHWGTWAPLAPLCVVLLLLMLGEAWLSAAPDASWTTLAWPTLGIGLAVAAWAGAWALVNQLFHRRFPFAQHLRLAVVALLVLAAVDYATAAVAYAFSWPALLVLEHWAGVLIGLFTLWCHGRVVWPTHGRGTALMLLGGLAIFVAMGWQSKAQQQHRWQPLYNAALPPPALRVAPLRTPDALLQDAAALREELARKAKLDPATGAEADDEAE